YDANHSGAAFSHSQGQYRKSRSEPMSSGLPPKADLRSRVSRVTVGMYSTTGPTPRFIHIWPYASLEERQRIRKEAVDKKLWPPPGGPERLVAQQTDIYLPAPFSPMK